jgi:hypothetical protein
MFVRENKFLLAIKNIAEELLEMQTPAGVETQAYRLLKEVDAWRISESPKEDGSLFRKKFPLPHQR